ncbi:WD repeat-containing protein 24 [Hypsibius exemplaris]|uniref:GATOR2 complex protein WDR24 n=1 Tax=Hypsibius exemplaris TaxID=2072580 RepID=A0A1W0WM21_HYPEX|nr:WD repeat-containing protein 24 [Hypsibius exemplaris]
MDIGADSKASSFSINLESPIKAVALNRAGTQVVAAGRNLLRIFSINENGFVEQESLRFSNNNRSNPTNQLGGQCTDVAWNLNDENILASSTTTGAVAIWNLSMNAVVKQDMIFTEHRRTANRVCFHPTEVHSLLSGSQDASAILFDLRNREHCTIFRCEEAVRDVRFSPHQYFEFVVCLENGNVQIFDMRNADTCVREFTCHAGPVFQSHFHPTDKTLLATCGRDKCIKVWNILENKNPSLEYTVSTIAPTGCIAWRPGHDTHIASTALTTDFSISIWDLRRPFVPFASFEKQTDLVTCLVWKLDPNIIISGSRDGLLSQFVTKDACRPADKLNPVGLDIGSSGDLALACSNRILQGYGRKSGKQKLQNMFKEELSIAEEFRLNATSKLLLYPYEDVPSLSMEWFVESAKGYLLYGRSVAELCANNADVAERNGRNQVAQVWRIVGFLYASSDNNRNQKSGHSSGDNRVSQRHLSEGRREELLHVLRFDDATSEAPYSDNIFHRNTRNLSTREPSLAMEPTSGNAGDFLFNEQTVFEEVDTPFTGVETMVDEDAWQLQTEGFQLRHELPDRSDSHIDGLATKDINRDRNRSGSLGPDDHSYEDALRFGSMTALLTRGPTLDFSQLVQETVHFYAEQGDPQTAVSLILVLGERIRSHFKEALLEAWMLDYIDLLSHFQLFTVANEVIKLSHVSAVGELNQQSTTVYTSCNNCGKHLHKTSWYCTNCKKLTNCCSICQLPVRGLYVWCQGCQHGGHLEHMEQWFRHSLQCPTGSCGHYCEFI